MFFLYLWAISATFIAVYLYFLIKLRKGMPYGEIVIKENETGKLISLEIDGLLEDIEKFPYVSFKVTKPVNE